MIGANKRLDALVHDSIFASRLTMIRFSSNDSIYPLPDPMLDRFCSEILPKIHRKIKWLDVESSSMERILLVANYSNLYGLALYNIDEERAKDLFI
ncbi:unnamed protein product, partial [Rotaria sp. Silwood2]